MGETPGEKPQGLLRSLVNFGILKTRLSIDENKRSRLKDQARRQLDDAVNRGLIERHAVELHASTPIVQETFRLYKEWLADPTEEKQLLYQASHNQLGSLAQKFAFLKLLADI